MHTHHVEAIKPIDKDYMTHNGIKLTIIGDVQLNNYRGGVAYYGVATDRSGYRYKVIWLTSNLTNPHSVEPLDVPVVGGLWAAIKNSGR